MDLKGIRQAGIGFLQAVGLTSPDCNGAGLDRNDGHAATAAAENLTFTPNNSDYFSKREAKQLFKDPAMGRLLRATNLSEVAVLKEVNLTLWSLSTFANHDGGTVRTFTDRHADRRPYDPEGMKTASDSSAIDKKKDGIVVNTSIPTKSEYGHAFESHSILLPERMTKSGLVGKLEKLVEASSNAEIKLDGQSVALKTLAKDALGAVNDLFRSR